MTTLTRYHALALEEFLRELGVLRGLRQDQVEEIVGDLCILVRCIVSEAVLDAMQEMQAQILLDGFDVLDQQRAWVFENVKRQMECTQ